MQRLVRTPTTWFTESKSLPDSLNSKGVALRLLVLSDLHLDLGASYAVPADCKYDVVVLAGDINSPGHRAVRWARRSSTFGGRPVVLVPGNHEFYGSTFESQLKRQRVDAEGTKVHVLHRNSVVIEDVRFLGCTLWTDFALPLMQDDGSRRSDVESALKAANRSMNDYRQIHIADEGRCGKERRTKRRRLLSEDVVAMHAADRDWLMAELNRPFAGPTVVVTHHGPSRDSVPPEYESDELSPAYVSDLPAAFFEVPSVWLHGHVHSSFNYVVGACRVISNPRGYPRMDRSFDNDDFDAGLVVEVSRL